MSSQRSIFFVSDHTGITAETLGRGLLSQFDHIEFKRTTLPFVDSEQKAHAAAETINLAARSDGVRPLVISSIAAPAIRAIVASADALVMDVFEMFIPVLESELGMAAAQAVGRLHRIGSAYGSRIDALNFTLAHDDGLGSRLEDADIVLLGVSRCGKTPTCLYLAMQYGVYAANYPLTPEDLDRSRLPPPVAAQTGKLFGLSISPERLHEIRQERRPNSTYASLANCQWEVRQAEALFQRLGIPYLDATSMSIEEIASTLLHKNLKDGWYAKNKTLR